MSISTKVIMTAVNQIADKIGNNKSNKKGFIVVIITLLLFIVFVVILAVMVIFAPVSWFLNLIGVLDFRVSKSDIIKYADTPKIECIQCVSDIVYPTTTENTLIKTDSYTIFDNAENSEVVAIYDDGIVKDLGFNENGRYIVMKYMILMQEDTDSEENSNTENQEDTDNNINNENEMDTDNDNNKKDETDIEEETEPIYYYVNLEMMYEGILQNYAIRGNETKQGQIIAKAKEKSLKITILNQQKIYKEE